MKYKFILHTCFLIVQLFFSRFVYAQQKSTPNIVIIMADDLGYGDFGIYGASKISSPTVDAIAREGMRFTDAHTASSLCSPSRYSMLTGRYSWRTRLRAGVLTWFAPPLIEEDQTTMPSMLKKAGYYTACIGKWHLGFDWALKPNAPADPLKNIFNSWERSTQDYIDFSKPVKQGPITRGFDYFYGISASNNMIPFVFIENEMVVMPPTIPKEYVYDTDQESTRAANWNLETLDQDLTNKAVNVIDQHFKKANDQPLFLYYPTSAIHRPCLPNKTKGKSQAGLRGDMVMEFDELVKQVVEALKRNKVLDNTILIITSDNGPVPGDPVLQLERYQHDMGDRFYLPYFDHAKVDFINPDGNDIAKKGWRTYDHAASGEFLGFKSDAWEGGHRVPLIIRWPSHIQAGSVSNAMICNSDLIATLAELTNIPISKNEAPDSYSYLPLLLGKNLTTQRLSMTIAAGGSGAFIVRQGNWKYIESGKPNWGQTFYPKGPITADFQLYLLSKDPSESNNLYNSQPLKVAELKKIIQNTKAGIRESLTQY